MKFLAPTVRELLLFTSFFVLTNQIVFGSESISGFCWHDLDGNGIQDNAEPGIQGVTVEMYAEAGSLLVATTTSVADGTYTFAAVTPGNYYLKFLLIPDYALTKEMVGNDRAKDSDPDPSSQITGVIVVGAGQNITNIDAGYNQTGEIAGTVWDDNNANGQYDLGENGIHGVQVQLYKDSILINTMSTNSTGGYDFEFLDPGSGYEVRFSSISGHIFSISGYDSDADVNGNVANVDVVSGNMTVRNAGIALPFNASFSATSANSATINIRPWGNVTPTIVLLAYNFINQDYVELEPAQTVAQVGDNTFNFPNLVEPGATALVVYVTNSDWGPSISCLSSPFTVGDSLVINDLQIVATTKNSISFNIDASDSTTNPLFRITVYNSATQTYSELTGGWTEGLRGTQTFNFPTILIPGDYSFTVYAAPDTGPSTLISRSAIEHIVNVLSVNILDAGASSTTFTINTLGTGNPVYQILAYNFGTATYSNLVVGWTTGISGSQTVNFPEITAPGQNCLLVFAADDLDGGHSTVTVSSPFYVLSPLTVSSLTVDSASHNQVTFNIQGIGNGAPYYQVQAYNYDTGDYSSIVNTWTPGAAGDQVVNYPSITTSGNYTIIIYAASDSIGSDCVIAFSPTFEVGSSLAVSITNASPDSVAFCLTAESTQPYFKIQAYDFDTGLYTVLVDMWTPTVSGNQVVNFPSLNVPGNYCIAVYATTDWTHSDFVQTNSTAFLLGPVTGVTINAASANSVDFTIQNTGTCLPYYQVFAYDFDTGVYLNISTPWTLAAQLETRIPIQALTTPGHYSLIVYAATNESGQDTCVAFSPTITLPGSPQLRIDAASSDKVTFTIQDSATTRPVYEILAYDFETGSYLNLVSQWTLGTNGTQTVDFPKLPGFDTYSIIVFAASDFTGIDTVQASSRSFTPLQLTGLSILSADSGSISFDLQAIGSGEPVFQLQAYWYDSSTYISLVPAWTEGSVGVQSVSFSPLTGAGTYVLILYGASGIAGTDTQILFSNTIVVP